MARLTAISGLGRKSAAIFLLEISGRRLLLDFGAKLEVGETPDLSGLGPVDAVLISHAHIDHCGSLDRLDEIGNPTVYATAETLRHIPAALRPVQSRLRPESGETDLLELRLVTGHAGHAPGGVWLHFQTKRGGFLYTGDFSTEASQLICDPFPKASTVLADASYGDRDSALPDQMSAIAQSVCDGAVLPCPAVGRGPDMVTGLASRGLTVHACPEIAAETRALTGHLPPIVDSLSACNDQIIVAAGPNGESGLPAELLERPGFRFIFSSHVPRTSPAHSLIADGRARWMPWNVHPRRSDLLAMAEHCAARQVIPAFVDPEEAPCLTQMLGARLVRSTQIEV